MFQKRFPIVAFGAAALLALLVSCGSPGEAGPEPGSAEWYWQAALENLETNDFAKAVDHLNAAADIEDPSQDRAILLRTIVLAGLARGYMRFADGLREGIDANSARGADYRTPLQQALRDARQYAIELAESLGDVDKVMQGETVVYDFDFPSGSAGESPLLQSLEKGEAVSPPQLGKLKELMLRRHIILAATECGGFQNKTVQAKSAFNGGPVQVSRADARMAVAKVLLDVSVLFDRLRVNDPEIRQILVDRSEKWCKPFTEAENEELKAAAEDFLEEIEDERRDMEGKRRLLDRRG